jgi:hypothetical protein
MNSYVHTLITMLMKPHEHEHNQDDDEEEDENPHSPGGYNANQSHGAMFGFDHGSAGIEFDIDDVLPPHQHPTMSRPTLSSQSEPADLYPELPREAQLRNLQTALDFIHELRDASEENSQLSQEFWAQLHDPLQETFSIDNPDDRFCLDVYLATHVDHHGARGTYNAVCQAYELRHPGVKLLSHDQISRRVAQWSGIQIYREDMCPSGCTAYTGPNRDLDQCPVPSCREYRYDQQVLASSKGKTFTPRLQFFYLPAGPQIQAQWAREDGAMHYAFQEMKKNIAIAREHSGNMPYYFDVYSGYDFMER